MVSLDDERTVAMAREGEASDVLTTRRPNFTLDCRAFVPS